MGGVRVDSNNLSSLFKTDFIILNATLRTFARGMKSSICPQVLTTTGNIWNSYVGAECNKKGSTSTL